MLTRIYPQTPTDRPHKKIGAILVSLMQERQWREISGIFAYTTAGGLLQLLNPINDLSPRPELNWLLGLDDFLTEPGAIRLAQSNSSLVKVVGFQNTRSRFHPKVLYLGSLKGDRDTCVIGSANLTQSGLNTNSEAIAILNAESKHEAARLQDFTATLFDLGHEPSEDELRVYENAYRSARFHYRQLSRISIYSARSSRVHVSSKSIAENEEISQSFDPTLATRCWIEVGKNTAEGRELEIKSEQALFFGLNRSGGDRQAKMFSLSNGELLSLNFKYQKRNSMWRLQLRNEVPEVRRGLRPRVDGVLVRSPYAAVFECIDERKRFKLKFIEVESEEFRQLRNASRETGLLGRTTTREYGWY